MRSLNNATVGVILTLVTLGAIGLAAQPAPPVQGLSPQQAEALRKALDLPPGREVEVEFVHKDGGSIKTKEEGRGLGAGATAEGDKLSESFTGSPPSVGLGEGRTAQGGGSDREGKASAFVPPAQAWQNPLFWVGLLCLGACGFCVYAKLRRGATISGVAGAALLAAAFYPWLMLFAVAGVVAVIFGPYLWAEFQKRKHEGESNSAYEALRAVVAGVEHKDVPENVRGLVKAAIAKEADAADKAVIDEVKRDDRVGKYAD